MKHLTRQGIPTLYTLLGVLALTLQLVSADEAKVIIETKTDPAAKQRVYSASANSVVTISTEYAFHEITLSVATHSGTEGPFSVEWFGGAKVQSVVGEQVASWAVRSEGKRQFLEIEPKKEVKSLVATIKARSSDFELPALLQLSHIGKGKAVALTNQVSLNFAAEVYGQVQPTASFQPIQTKKRKSKQYQTTTGGTLAIKLFDEIGRPPKARLVGASLVGTPNIKNQTVEFRLTGKAIVTDSEFKLPLLSGKAAVVESRSPEGDYQVELVRDKAGLQYVLRFDDVGEFDIDLDIAARLENENVIGFKLLTADILPVELTGLDQDYQFSQPGWQHSNGKWQGFAAGNGGVELTWNRRVDQDKGELFFSTTGIVETRIGTGLARQSHQLNYQILQGKLSKLELQIVGGKTEVVSVAGPNILSWDVKKDLLTIQLSKPASKAAQYTIVSQSSLADLPTTITPIRIDPIGSIRHAGYMRLINEGSVRLEPSNVSGLTQLVPSKFPGKPVKSRQSFVYRFPAKDYQCEVSCDRIQPEVQVAEIVHYQVSDTERSIRSSVELDIREAPIREWNVLVPEDYSVVTVTGSGIADYVLATEVENGQRNLKCIYSADAMGRKLIRLVLEKNIPVADGVWELPRLGFPDAESYRCDLGISASPGYRLSLEEQARLVERPLSDFPGNAEQLQHYLRVREARWQASVKIQTLPQSVQSDCFHLYSLGEGRAFGSVLVNYLINGAPVSEFTFIVPAELENVVVETKNLRSQKLVDGQLNVSLHQPILGAHTVLITFEQDAKGPIQPGQITPVNVASESGYIQIVSPLQVGLKTSSVSANLLKLDHLELPPEFRLLSSAPSLGIWQYTERLLTLDAQIDWLEPGDTIDQVVEFSEAVTTISQSNESVTDLVYYIKSQDSRPLSLRLPENSKIWDVRTNGRNVASRQNDEFTQIPLVLSKPGELTAVKLRLGNAVVGNRIALPILNVPVLKTEWKVLADKGQVTDIQGRYKNASASVMPPKGFRWVAGSGLLYLLGIIALVIVGLVFSRSNNWARWLAPLFFIGAIVLSVWISTKAHNQMVEPKPLSVNLPVIASGEAIELQTKTIPLDGINVPFLAIVAFIIGGLCLLAIPMRSLISKELPGTSMLMAAGVFLVGVGFLLLLNGAFLFFGYLALVVILFLLIPFVYRQLVHVPKAAATAAIVLLSGVFASGAEQAPVKTSALDSIQEIWRIDMKNKQISADVTAKATTGSGRVFKLVSSPAVLTNYNSKQLTLQKSTNPQNLTEYFAVSPSTEDSFDDEATSETYTLKYTYRLPFTLNKGAIVIPSGMAASHQIEVLVDEPGWSVKSTGAAKIDRKGKSTKLTMLPQGPFRLTVSPETRDLSEEKSEFYVESQQVYVPSPGVIDATHQFTFRSSRGQIKELKFRIPPGMTVSEVKGPIKSWQFNPESRLMTATVDPPQAETFVVNVSTQSGLTTFPAKATLAPINVDGAAGETGLLALGFSGEAQPEKVVANKLSQVNIDDFTDAPKGMVLHQVYRYRPGAGNIVVDVAAVAPEIRSTSRQVLSLGDEDLLYQINYAVQITRSGVFKLSIPIPEGYEVNSLSGKALSHWTENVVDNQRVATMHLNGKTIGEQSFSLSLLASTPARDQAWALPAFPISEASRHTGEIIIQPATGIRLTLADRKNAIELDPRNLGATQKGALAFRTLQKDWQLTMLIENRPPRLTAELLHDVKIREAQVFHSIQSRVKVENAAIRSLAVNLPVSDEIAEGNLRISGRNVSGFSKSETGQWVVQLKRWTLGNVDFSIDWEQRQQVQEGPMTLQPVSIDSIRQPVYYLSVRPIGRLEAELPEANREWRRVDWNAVSESLRQAGPRTAPSLALRASSTVEPILLELKRHTLADALKLRIARGMFNTVISPLGSRLTSAELDIEVIQRSQLTMTLPSGSEMFSLFVNQETIQPVKIGADQWRFPILPNAIGRQARVTVIYVEQSPKIKNAKLVGPIFGIPMENITWNILAPETYEMSSHRGNLSLVESGRTIPFVSRQSYLQYAQQRRQKLEDEAVKLLTQANKLIQEGKPILARQALHSLANRGGLDAASNEDARVQLETLQTQQALVGLNSRKQRLYLDHNYDVENGVGNQSNEKQIVESASRNPVIQLGDLNFRPDDLSQLLQGNSSDELVAMRRIAARMIKQQQREVMMMPGLDITPPYEGKLYQFTRGLQVNDTAPLQLDLNFNPESTGGGWRLLLALLMLAVLAGCMALGWRKV